MDQQNQPKQKSAFFTLRAIVAFVLLGALIVGIYLVGFRSWREVAEWGENSNHEVLIYDDETYVLEGVLKEKGDLTLEKYPIHKVLGQVKQDGTLMTDAEDTTPDGTPTLPREHTYIVYAVKNMEDYLIVLEKNGEYYLYQKSLETEAES